METTRLHRHFYDFSIHYDSIDIADILDIHKNLMKKHNINQCLDLFKKRFIGFVSVCVVGSFGASLAINYKDSIKCWSLNNHPCQATITHKIFETNSSLHLK